MTNNIQQLRNKLFAQIDALGKCNSKDLDNEIKRSKALTGVAEVIVDTAKVEVDFYKSMPTETKHIAAPSFLELPPKE